MNEQELASRLVWQGHVTLKHLQLALEWQRQKGGSVVDLLVQMRATSEDIVEKATRELQGGEKSFARGSLHSFAAPTLAPDRRTFHRTKIPDNCSVRIGDFSDDAKFELLNVSMGGLAFRTSQTPPAMGSLLDVQLTSPKGNALHVESKVCHIARPGERYSIGLEFIDLSASTLLVLDRIVREFAPTNQD